MLNQGFSKILGLSANLGSLVEAVSFALFTHELVAGFVIGLIMAFNTVCR